MKQFSPLMKLVLLSLFFGIIGGTITTWALQSIEKTSTASGGKIIEKQEIVKEKIFSSSITDVAKEVSPSVVSIIVTKELTRYRTNPNDFFFNDPFFEEFFGSSPYEEKRAPEVQKEKRQVAGGTGFVVSADGKIITNKHVVSVENAEYTVLFNDGTERSAKILSRDPSNDLAVLQLETKEGEGAINVKPLQLGNPKNVQVGQIVIAIGNALGEFENTVTMGVISAKNRKIIADDNTRTGESLSNLLQTDAAINPGNSGGPLLSLDGEVIGVNTAIAQGANGIGFAIPVSEVQAILKSISNYGKIVRPFLGVVYKANSPEIAKMFDLPVTYGAIIQASGNENTAGVVKDGPADKAGIIAGDIILSINNQKIDANNDLKDIITQFGAQEEVELKILRGSNELIKKVTLGKREDESTDTKNTTAQASQVGNTYIGINVKKVTKELKETYGLKMEEGLLLFNDFENSIPAVLKDSPAKEAGLQANDVLIEIDGEVMKEESTLTNFLSKKKPGDKIKVKLDRNGIKIEKEIILKEKPKGE